MYIKLGQSVSPLGLPQSRLTLTARGAVESAVPPTIHLSEAVRSYAATMMELAHASGCEASFHLLLPDDRSVLLFARQLVDELGLSPHEVHKLVFDLCMYRLGEPTEEAAAPTLGSGRIALLPALPAKDEAEARTILSSLALRDTAIDRGFLGDLLNPERTRVPRVDFTFLRQLVVTSSRSFADGARDPDVSLQHRDARTLLAQAVATLAPALHVTEQIARNALREGPALVRQRLLDPPMADATQPEQRLDLAHLTRQDRRVLALLYTAARSQGVELSLVDDLAHALLDLRRSERPLATPAPPVVVVAQREPQQVGPLPLASTPEARAAHASSLPVVQESADHPAALLPQRLCESSAQLLSRSVSSYRSVAPPGSQRPDAGLHAGFPATQLTSRLPSAGGDALAPGLVPHRPEAATLEAAVHGAAFRAPLDLAQALGVGPMLQRARRRPLRTTPGRAAEQRARADNDHTGSERELAAEHEQAPSSALTSGRQGRWQLLLVRRRRTRQRGRSGST
jgi:hypothetical protein